MPSEIVNQCGFRGNPGCHCGLVPLCEPQSGPANQASSGTKRSGLTSFEMIVALMLFMSALLVATPLMVRHGRLLVDQRRYRIALDEVSNQLDRLSSLPADQVAAALEQVKVDDWTLARLPGAVLVGQLEPVDLGNRLTLELTYGAEAKQPWGQPGDGPKRKKVALESWIAPAVKKASTTPAEDAP